MVVFSIVDVKMFVIRLVVFFLVLGLLLTMFTALGAISLGSEAERKLNELGEAMLSSEFTVARAIFDPLKPVPRLGNRTITDLNVTTIEPLHVCEHFAYFEFFIREGGKLTKKYSFGVRGGMELASREWPVWFVQDGSVTAGIMRITLGTDAIGLVGELGFDDLTCAIERAWLYKRPFNVTARICPGDYECSIWYDEPLLILEQYVYGPPITKQRHVEIAVRPETIEAGTRDITVFPIKEVPGASYVCPNPTTFENDSDRFAYAVDRVILCDVTKG